MKKVYVTGAMQNYYGYTMEWLKASECVVVCPNWRNSKK